MEKVTHNLEDNFTYNYFIENMFYLKNFLWHLLEIGRISYSYYVYYINLISSIAIVIYFLVTNLNLTNVLFNPLFVEKLSYYIEEFRFISLDVLFSSKNRRDKRAAKEIMKNGIKEKILDINDPDLNIRLLKYENVL